MDAPRTRTETKGRDKRYAQPYSQKHVRRLEALLETKRKESPEKETRSRK